jgi:hypothetical protein
MNKNIPNEIPKHKKNTGSNISDSAKKTKHKHHYEECLIQYNFSFSGKESHVTTDLQSYCIVCGKIGNRFNANKSIVKDYYRTTNSVLGMCRSVITSQELYDRYHNKIPVFFVEDIYKNKYVDLKQNNN